MSPRQAASELISIDPANGAEIARVRITSAQELDAVVARAWNAFRHSGWKSLLPLQRALVLHAIADDLAAEKQALDRLQSQDNGKPWGECRAMVEWAIDMFRYYAGVFETRQADGTPVLRGYVSFAVL